MSNVRLAANEINRDVFRLMVGVHSAKWTCYWWRLERKTVGSVMLYHAVAELWAVCCEAGLAQVRETRAAIQARPNTPVIEP